MAHNFLRSQLTAGDDDMDISSDVGPLGGDLVDMDDEIVLPPENFQHLDYNMADHEGHDEITDERMGDEIFDNFNPGDAKDHDLHDVGDDGFDLDLDIPDDIDHDKQQPSSPANLQQLPTPQELPIDKPHTATDDTKDPTNPAVLKDSPGHTTSAPPISPGPQGLLNTGNNELGGDLDPSHLPIPTNGAEQQASVEVHNEHCAANDDHDDYPEADDNANRNAGPANHQEQAEEGSFDDPQADNHTIAFGMPQHSNIPVILRHAKIRCPLFPVVSAGEENQGYLLDDRSLLNEPISKVFDALRDRFISGTKQNLEMVFDVPQLRLTLPEESPYVSTQGCSLQKFVGLYAQFAYNDDYSDPPPFIIQLTLRENVYAKWRHLRDAANEGKGLAEAVASVHHEDAYEVESLNSAGEVEQHREAENPLEHPYKDDLSYYHLSEEAAEEEGGEGEEDVQEEYHEADKGEHDQGAKEGEEGYHEAEEEEGDEGGDEEHLQEEEESDEVGGEENDEAEGEEYDVAAGEEYDQAAGEEYNEAEGEEQPRDLGEQAEEGFVAEELGPDDQVSNRSVDQDHLGASEKVASKQAPKPQFDDVIDGYEGAEGVSVRDFEAEHHHEPVGTSHEPASEQSESSLVGARSSNAAPDVAQAGGIPENNEAKRVYGPEQEDLIDYSDDEEDGIVDPGHMPKPSSDAVSGTLVEYKTAKPSESISSTAKAAEKTSTPSVHVETTPTMAQGTQAAKDPYADLILDFSDDEDHLASPHGQVDPAKSDSLPAVGAGESLAPLPGDEPSPQSSTTLGRKRAIKEIGSSEDDLIDFDEEESFSKRTRTSA